MRKNRIIAILLFVVMTVLTTACGSSTRLIPDSLYDTSLAMMTSSAFITKQEFLVQMKEFVDPEWNGGAMYLDKDGQLVYEGTEAQQKYFSDFLEKKITDELSTFNARYVWIGEGEEKNPFSNIYSIFMDEKEIQAYFDKNYEIRPYEDRHISWEDNALIIQCGDDVYAECEKWLEDTNDYIRWYNWLNGIEGYRGIIRNPEEE